MGAKMPKYDWPVGWPDPERLGRNGLGLILLVATFITAVPAFWVVLKFFGALVTGDSVDIRNIGLIYLAVLGAPFVMWRAIIAQGNLDRSRDRDYADLFTRSVEQLGATREVELWKTEGIIPNTNDKKRKVIRHEPNIEVRLGAIYALKRVSEDSERDHLAVVETLCAYVRENFPASHYRERPEGTGPEVARTDLLAIITILGNRTKERRDYERERKFRMNLRRCDFSGTDFSGGDFSAALFTDSHFNKARFWESKLNGTRFDRCQFRNTRILSSELKGTDFDLCKMVKNVELEVTEGEYFTVCDADLTGFCPEIHSFENMFGSKDTKILRYVSEKNYAEELRKNLKRLRHKLKKTDGIDNDLEEEIQDKTDELNRNEFRNWSNHNIYDGLTLKRRSEFLAERGMPGWPYQYE